MSKDHAEEAQALLLRFPGHTNSADRPADELWHHRNDQAHLVPTAIDPEGCGCTECLVREYIPLDQATPEMIRDMLAGYIKNYTERVFYFEIRVTSNDGGTPATWMHSTIATYGD